MTTFKPGDRVKVEFEGTVSSFYDDYSIEVKLGGYEIRSIVPKALCTLIEPEIVLPEIPGTIVQIGPFGGPSEFEWVPHLGKWRSMMFGHTAETKSLIQQCRRHSYRVIPAATPEEVK